MSEFKNLTLDVADQIAVLAISRPAALNALNSETLDELNVALTEIEARDDVKVLILTGGPDKKGNEFKSFVAGADISEMVNFTAPQARAFGIKASAILQAHEYASGNNRSCQWIRTRWRMRDFYGV